MALKTLNQIVDRIRTISLAHKQVNSFFYGEVPEVDSREDIVYPIVYLESLPGSINRAARLQTFNFRLYAFDLVNVAESAKLNQTDVLSDMSQVVSDILSVMMGPSMQFDWEVGQSAGTQVYTEAFADMAGGASIDISVGLEWLADSCEVPIDDLPIIPEFDMARTRLFTYEATGSEGNSIPVADLVGLPIIGVFRAGRYKRPVAVTPTDTEMIQVGTVDLGKGKGVTSNGALVLESDDAPVAGEKIDILYYN